jgi:hypothetical protein
MIVRRAGGSNGLGARLRGHLRTANLVVDIAVLGRGSSGVARAAPPIRPAATAGSASRVTIRVILWFGI